MENKLEHYIINWKLQNPQKLTSTKTSDLYIVDSKEGKAVLKILNEVGLEDEVAGIHFLKIFDGHGCAKLYEHNEEALLMEFLPGDDLYQFSKISREEKASKIFCVIIRQLRSLEVSSHTREKFKSVSSFLDNYTNFYSQISIPQENREIIEKGSYLFKRLLETQSEEVLLHGDLHHENIRSRLKGDFVCYDPKALRGDPAYELGTTLKNPWDYPNISHDRELFQSRAKYFAKELNLNYQRVICYAFVHLCLSSAWSIKSEGWSNHSFNIAKTINGIIPEL